MGIPFSAPVSLKKEKPINRVNREIYIDERGSLMPFDLENQALIPYKRIFCTADLIQGEMRGSHAHKKQTQLLFVIQGEFKITFENKNEKGEVVLNNMSAGIEIPPITWSTQTPTQKHSVLLVFSSDRYEEVEYIRDYNEFIKLSRSS
jgi:UDP-2-acetamido-3-amino-2,3-dideoxy-glucuronate N-acetyltransferase